jgi:hypothetical protein
VSALPKFYPERRVKLPPRRERRQKLRWLRKNVRIVMNLPGLIPGPMFAGAAYDAPGSQTFTTPGADTFVIPNYSTTLTITLWGAGASGQAAGGGGWANGTASTVVSLSLSAGGGNASSGGTASGGDTNTNGNNGAANSGVTPGAGGAGIDGYGTGGSGQAGSGKTNGGYGGGSGAKVIKAYALGALTPGASLSLVIGTGGVNALGQSGLNGRIEFSWT